MRDPRSRLAAAASLALALAAAIPVGPAAAGPADRWVELTPAGPLPPARVHAAVGYDRGRNRLLVFGGSNGSGELDDTWVLDLATMAWREVAAPVRPEPRFSMVAGVDDARGRFLITTGQGSGFYNDVWALDLAAETWRRLTPAGAGPPAARYGSAGGAQRHRGLGAPSAGGLGLLLSHGFTTGGRFDDTWVFRFASDAWEELTPATGPIPLPRCLHGGDAVGTEALLLFGGCASGFGPCPLDDAWRFDLGARAWTEVPAGARPAARTHPALASLGGGGEAVAFGGSPGGDEVWLLDAAAGAAAWTRKTPGGAAPAPREGAALVWVDGADPFLDGAGCGWLLLFGGGGGGAPKNDLWALLPASPPRPPVVQAVKAPGGGVTLSWTHAASTRAYEVWRGDVPRFIPGGPALLPGAPTVVGTEAAYTDAAPPPAATAYYRVRLASCGG